MSRIHGQIGEAFRLALKRMARAPLAALPPILVVGLTTLALTVALSLLQGVLFKPLPYPQPERLLQVGWQTNPGHDSPMNLTEAAANFLAEQPALFAALTRISDPGMPVVLGDGAAAHAAAALRADAGFMATLGLSPSRGRAPTAAEIDARLPQALISPALWRRHFGEREFSPTTLRIEGVPHTVLGLLPAAFRFDPPVELVLPWSAGGLAAQGHNTLVLARLPAGVALSAAQSRVDAQAAALIRDFGGSVSPGATPAFKLRTLQSVVVGDAGQLLWPLAGAVGLLVLLAAFNLANLQLAQLLARRAETAVRGVLGAEAWMLRLPGIAEATLRVGFGTALGLIAAGLALPLLLTMLPTTLPRLAEVGLDARTLLGVVAVALLLLAVSIAVTLLGERAGALRGEARGSRRLGLQPLLVAAQVALSATLLAGALMSVGSLQRLLSQDPGYRVEGVEVASLLLPAARYADPALASTHTATDLERLAEALRATPGVLAVASSSSPPLSRGLNNWVVARGTPSGEAGASVEMRIVSPGYLEVLGARLVAGRDFGPGDAAGAAPVAIVNQRFAAQYLPANTAIGARIDVGGVEHEVIGISADLREQSLREAALPTVLVAQAQTDPALQAAVNRWFGAQLLIHAAPGTAVDAALREALGAIGHAAVPRQLQPLRALESASVAQERLVATLLGSFTLLALALAALGLYALLEHLRRERERELAVRLALGARAGQNATLLLQSQLRLTALGLVAGAIGAMLL
nr:ABC transporter permease [Xanthomonadales bacterium]